MRLIDADALAEKKFQERECNGLGEGPAYRQGWNDAIDAVMDNEPSAQPERKKGEWSDGYRWQRCSLCKQTGKKSWNYCPNCGADMRGEKDG